VGNRAPSGKGFVLRTTSANTVELALNDGKTESRWASDPETVQAGKLHHIAVIVDGGPKVISFVIDGKLNDGGDSRQFGWGRYNPHLQSANGDSKLRIGSGVKRLCIYNRYLRTSEAVASFRAGIQR
jgi:hypothetical protein